MRFEYTLSRSEALRMTTDFLTRKNRASQPKRKLILACILVGAAFSFGRPATYTPNGSIVPIPSALLTILLQVPLIALFAYGSVAVIASAYRSRYQRLIQKTIADQPEDHWGKRIFEIADGKVRLASDITSHSILADHIDDIVATASSYHLIHAKQPVFQIPKSLCSLEDLRESVDKERRVHPASPPPLPQNVATTG